MAQIFTDSLHRIAYSTDASTYREVPAGVAYPNSVEDIKELLTQARKRGVSIIARAGGTSIAGQVVGSGIVVDISKHLNHIIEINKERRYAIVEPGVVLDELNIACKPYGLFFSPETSTSSRCCIGGMFGNNSCGLHSLVYGSTRQHILESHGVLADGSEEDFRTYTIAQLESRFGAHFWEYSNENSPLIEQIYSQLIDFALNPNITKLIADNYPDKTLKRRSCGYAIDEVIEDLVAEDKPFEQRSINLCKLLCGSEGTLAFITQIKVDLDPLPPQNKMAICVHCDTLPKCYTANLVCLRHNPDAIELIDGHILDLARQNGAQQSNRFFVVGEPAGLLAVEITDNDQTNMHRRAEALEKELIEGGYAYTCTEVVGADISKVWSLRKAGLGLLSGMKGDAKPIGVIEDTAVSPLRLPDYLADFATMLATLKLDCVYYGHISTGELHLRPILNIKTNQGKALFRSVAEQTALLVKKHHGSLSGEHGDGRLRGEFIPLMYGEQTYDLMRQVKQRWDRDGVFNVGKIIDTPPMDSNLRFDVNQQYEIEKLLPTTYFNWKAAFDECKVKGASGVSSQWKAFMCSVEQCNGAGDCRKSNLIGGTLCPAYKVSHDETKATRARANVLREILTRGWKSEAFSGAKKKGDILKSAEIKEVLDSCLACKGCKSECPSNVDLTRLRAEILQHIHDSEGTPFRSYMVARMAIVEKLGSIVAPIYNLFASCRPTAWIIKKALNFAIERDIPVLSTHTMRNLVKRERAKYNIDQSWRRVYLFADEFTNYQEAELGLTFAKLLLRLHYDVIIPSHCESGRAAISKGELKYAKKVAVKNVNLLADIVTPDSPIIGIEPSCILSFRDEYPDLVAPQNRDKAITLSKNCLLYDEFICNEIEKGNIKPEQFNRVAVPIWLHGHCHQKAIVGVERSAECLRKLLVAKVNVIPSGCCGMAGSYGYEKEHYHNSLEIGSMVLFPTIQKAMQECSDCIISAPGTSCRTQIKDGTGITALHPIQILYNNLK